MSLDASLPAEDGDVRLGDTAGADDRAFDLMVDREAARDGISSPAERAKLVLHLRFFAGMRQSAIAAGLGISPMHVSRLIAESCRRIRENAKCPAPEGARTWTMPGRHAPARTPGIGRHAWRRRFAQTLLTAVEGQGSRWARVNRPPSGSLRVREKPLAVQAVEEGLGRPPPALMAADTARSTSSTAKFTSHRGLR